MSTLVTMKCTIFLLLAAIIFHTALLKKAKRRGNNENRRTVKMLTDQLSKVKGVKTCNLYIDAKLKSTQITDMLQSQLAKSFPIVTIGKKNLRIDKFRMTHFTQLIRSKNREQKGLMNCASGNAILIAIVSWQKKYPMFLSNVAKVYETLALQSSIPKVFLISVTNKKQNYKRVFKYFASLDIIDVEILEISKTNRRLKRFLRAKKANFTVQKCNPFFKSYKKGKLRKKVGCGLRRNSGL